MEKTMKLLVLSMIITGALFAAGCQNAANDLVDDINTTIEDAADGAGDVVDEINEDIEDAAEATGEMIDEMEDAMDGDEENEDEDKEAMGYVDGIYSSMGSYVSPAGEETIDVSVTLEGGVVTAVDVNPNATHEISQKMQGQFAAGIGDVIVGKELDAIGTLDAVNGSSLTPGGFNAALDSIREEARAA